MGATLVLAEDGGIVDATPEALDLLGVGLEELRALPQGSFSADEPDPEAAAAFRTQWEAEGRPDIGGQATLKRLDGSLVRVRFAISQGADGRYLAALESVGGATDAPPELFTAGQVLAAWRAAERRLTALTPDDARFDAAMSEIEYFRARYQELFRGATRDPR